MDCLFCKIVNNEMESKCIYEDDLVKCIMDAYPNVDGHGLIIPKKHYTDYTELPAELVNHIYEVSKKLNPMLIEKLNVNSLSMVVNYLDAQVIKHFHLHLLPNYGKSTASKSVDEVFDLLTK